MYAAYRAHGITDPDALSLLSDLAATLDVRVDDPGFGEALTLLKDLESEELMDL